MSKDNIRKHISLRSGFPILDRRESVEDGKMEEIDSRLANTCEQTEIMKKIQNKLRMKKRSSNAQNERLSETPPEFGTTGNLSTNELTENEAVKKNEKENFNRNIEEKIAKVLERDENVINKMALERVDTEAIKEMLFKDSTFIFCLANKGKRIEEIILSRIEKIIDSNNSKRKIEVQEKNIFAMMDNRIKKLAFMQKQLVH